MRWLALVVALGLGCSERASESRGRVVVAITIDWEGAYFSAEGLDAIAKMREALAGVPVTHFVSAAYLTKAEPDPASIELVRSVTQRGDEIGLHLHAWRSLAVAAKVEPKLSPSYLTGTDKLLEFPDGDIGFDVDLDAYSTSALREMVRHSVQLLTPLAPSKSFRAGGYLATPRVLQAIRDEGFTVDTSATAGSSLSPSDRFLRERIKEVWPRITPTSQPFVIDTATGKILELPIATIDSTDAPSIVTTIEQAHATLRAAPQHDVFVVMAYHQETADEHVPFVVQAVQTLRPKLGNDLVFVTMQQAGERAQKRLGAAK